MRFPAGLYTSLAISFLKNGFTRGKRFPLVLMLEPTHRCNLSCAGCDRIRLHAEKGGRDLTLDECTDAALQSAAPVVTVTGGEPLLYPQLVSLIDRLLRMKRYVYLCTNGLLAASLFDTLRPHPRLSLNLHLDGMEKTHDAIAGRSGTFRSAIEAIRKAKRKGFRVCTTTSVYKNGDAAEMEELFALLSAMQVDGMLISPAFSYGSVPDDIFLTREEAAETFRRMAPLFKKHRFMSTPLYLDFLKGKRMMKCTPWGNPTRNPHGWKSPCYLVTDTYYASFEELMQRTDWDRYESGKDPRCRNCMVHSGYEATAMREAFSHPLELVKLARWNFRCP